MVVAKTRASARGRGILAALARLGGSRRRRLLAPVPAAARAATRLALLRRIAFRRRRRPVRRLGGLGDRDVDLLRLLAGRGFGLRDVDRRRLLAAAAAA